MPDTRLHAVLIIAILILSSISLALSSLSHQSISSSGIIEYFHPLKVEGRWIIDSRGNIFTLKGISGGDVSFVDQPCGNWVEVNDTRTRWDGRWKPEAVEANLDAIKAWGLNSIRVLFSAEFVKYNTANTNGGTFFDNIKQLLGFAAQRGIYVILCGYQLLSTGSSDALPYPPYQTGSNPNGTSTEALAVIGSEQDYIDLMVKIANELKNYRNVILQNWNEPAGGLTQEQRDQAKASWFNVTQRLVDALRGIGMENIILISGWGGLHVNIDYPDNAHTEAVDSIREMSLNGTNIVYDVHIYRQGGSFGTYANRTWEYNDVKLCLQWLHIDQVGEQWDKPLIIGEIGAELFDNDAEETNHELIAFENALSIFNEWQLGYLAWWWTNKGEHRLLQSDVVYIPPPNEKSDILRNAASYTGGKLGILKVESNIASQSLTVEPGGWIAFTPCVKTLDAGTYYVTINGTNFLRWNDGDSNATYKEVIIEPSRTTSLIATYSIS